MTEPALTALADDVAELDSFTEIERQTSMRQDAEMPLPAGLRRSELLTDARGNGWELVAGFLGSFADKQGEAQADYLDPDMSVGHRAGQKLARRLRDNGSPGLIYPSLRHSGSHCLAAFRPNLFQNIRQGDICRLAWSGNPTPQISQVAA